MVYVRKSCLARPAAELGYSIRTAIFAVLRISSDFASLSRGQSVPVNIYALSTLISVLFWVSVRAV
jgi:hypothetical protein